MEKIVFETPQLASLDSQVLANLDALSLKPAATFMPMQRTFDQIQILSKKLLDLGQNFYHAVHLVLCVVKIKAGTGR